MTVPSPDTAASRPEVMLLIPVFNDSESATLLLGQIAAEAQRLPYRLRVLFINDGSLPSEARSLPGHAPGLDKIDILHLRRNLGHQRAIAIGLAAVASEQDGPAYVVVMDGDGEDLPSTIGPLLEAAVEEGGEQAVFARRLKRHDGAGFMAGYHTFRFLHRLLVGRDISFGNFSVLPAGIIQRVVGISEIWNHYAAGVVHGRIPVRLVPTPRGRRLADRSKMNLPALVMHGISALSVWSDVIVARMFLLVATLLMITLALLAVVIVERFSFTSGIPGWAAGVAGILVVVVLLLGVVCLLLALFVLGSRSASSFLPHRDWRDYVLPEAETRS
jgi:polyisoprenyl-phosphate glycosyltransferase